MLVIVLFEVIPIPNGCIVCVYVMKGKTIKRFNKKSIDVKRMDISFIVFRCWCRFRIFARFMNELNICLLCMFVHNFFLKMCPLHKFSICALAFGCWWCLLLSSSQAGRFGLPILLICLIDLLYLLKVMWRWELLVSCIVSGDIKNRCWNDIASSLEKYYLTSYADGKGVLRALKVSFMHWKLLEPPYAPFI